jgi:hypothetical protein
MRRLAKEGCYLVYELFYSLGFGERDPDLLKLRAVLLVTLLEWALLVASANWLHVVMNWDVFGDLPRWAYFAAMVSLLLVNYLVVYRNAGSEAFERRFHNKPSQVRRRQTALALLVVLVTVSLIVWSFIALARHRAGS